MLKAQIIISRATKLPLLGVKTQPSPYLIIECDSRQYTSSISKYSQNPQWMHQLTIEASKPTCLIQIYIYNNNTNGVDELLAFGQMQFGDLLTRVNTQSRIKLQNSLGQKIDSYLFVQHFDGNPKDVYLPMNQNSCIKLRLISQLEQDSELICQYGQNSFGLSKQLSQNAFKFNPKQDRIRCLYRTIDKQQMQTTILTQNISQNSFFSLKFDNWTHQYTIFVSASVVINGLIPQNYNILRVQLSDLTKSSGKKVNNFKIKISGPLNEAVFNQKQELEVYVENYSMIVVQYFQEVDSIAGMQPYCSFQFSVNSLNWSKDNLQSSFTGKYYDSFKNIQTVISLKLMLKKNNEISKVIPTLNPPETLFDEDSTIIMDQLKLVNCFLFQVIEGSTVQLIHVAPKGYITAFSKFVIKQNKTEYVVDVKSVLERGGRGKLYLVSLDIKFTEEKTNSIEDYAIFKIEINKPNSFQQSKIDYTSKFLAFAKKVSVVKICKKFNQMVHDDQLKLKVKAKYTGDIKRGTLNIINAKCMGGFGDLQIGLTVDGSTLLMNGQIGTFLLDKGFLLNVGEGNIKLTLKLSKSVSQAKDKGNSSNSLVMVGRFTDFFGTPVKDKIYMFEMKLPPTLKLQIVYSFAEREKNIADKFIKTQEIFNFFEVNASVVLRLKRAFVSINNKMYTFRIARGQSIFETIAESTSNNKINFSQLQEVTLKAQTTDESGLIFLSAHSYDQEDKLIIYNGFINVKQFIGKGQYEVTLVYEKQQKKKQIYLILEVNHSCPSSATAAKMKLTGISSITSLPVFKNIYKHYLRTKINDYLYQITQCTLNEQSLILNSNLNIRNGDIVCFQLFSSFKSISKQLFHSSEKQLLAEGTLHWSQIEKNNVLFLNYYPKKQGQLKFTKSSLVMQEQSTKLLLNCSSQFCNMQARIQPIRIKTSNFDVDVLSGGVVKFHMKNIVLLINAKIVQIQFKSLGLVIPAQSKYSINRWFFIKAPNMQFQLEVTVTIKEAEKYRKITQTALVNLRRNHYKINQLTSIKVIIQKILVLNGDILIFNNKFINAPKGQLTLSQISFRGVQIDKYQILQCPTNQLNESNQSLLKKEGMQAKNCNIVMNTADELNGMCLSLQNKQIKLKQIICIAEMNIDRYEEEFIYERQILIAGESLIATLKVNYKCFKLNDQEEESIKYRINNGDQVTVKYNIDQCLQLKTFKKCDQFPKKNKGFIIKINIPKQLADKTKKIHLLTTKPDPISLSPSIVNNQEYIYFTNQQLTIESIQLFHSQLVNNGVQKLGMVDGVVKFMIDQNPKYICSVKTEIVSMANIANQNWTIHINFHRLFTPENKRILGLKNTAKDQVLTKQLGLLIKHGQQLHFVHNLNEYGSKNIQTPTEFQIGYDNNCDLLQFYLFIDNCFNKQNKPNLLQNWMQLMAVSYGSMNLSSIGELGMIGCQLKGLINNQINLEKALNDMIIRDESVYCLFGLSFQKKAWGYINLQLKCCSQLQLTGRKQKQQIYIYFKFEIQNGNRQVLKSFITEARVLQTGKQLIFTHNSLDFLFIQDNEPHYNLKINGYVIDATNRFQFLQKKQDITDCLQKRANHTLNIQIKANDTNNLCSNTFQLSLTIKNSSKLPQKINLIQKAKSINKVDALSFQQFANTQFFQRLLGCEHLSHFGECLQEMKESFIYSDNLQIQTFIFITEYLIFDWDPKVIGSICEIIHINLLKSGKVVNELQEKGIMNTVYTRFKSICKGYIKDIPSTVGKVSTKDYQETVAKFKNNHQLTTLRLAITHQATLMYTTDQLISRASSQHNESILNILILLVKYSKQIKQLFEKQMPEWMQMFGFTPNDNQFQLFMLLIKTCTQNLIKLDQADIIHWIDILLQKKYSLASVYQFWQQIKDKQAQLQLYLTILTKYQDQLISLSVQTCRGIRMMLSQIHNNKNIQLHDKLTLAHQPLLKQMIVNITKSNDIVLVSSHLDLLIHLYQLKMMDQHNRIQLEKIVKQKSNGIKEASSKLILNNYYNKISKKTQTVKLSNVKEEDKNMRKAGFYKKYLITSD